MRWHVFKEAEQLNIHREKAGKDINDVLSCARDAVFTTGASVAVVGGAARDMALGGAPRDIDLMICPKNEDDVYVLLSALDIYLGYKITADYRYDEDTGRMQNHATGADPYAIMVQDDRILRVVKLACPGSLDVDVLVSSNSTIRDAVERFDYNINMFIIRRHTTAPLYIGTTVGVLQRNLQATITADRSNHIKHIATAYNWSI
ncbi:hypothetical protein PssvBMR16_gp15 [Pseudomonas phage MR16]|nr:hypothetical protein PssvBMR16_gp15 [Pseudomonas phage MR16]